MNNSETYNYKVVRQFAIMTIVWGLVGMSVGVLIAAQLAWPALNFDIPWLTFSRLRPLHTNAVIFAFGGCALFASSYYVVQHTCHARLAFPALAYTHQKAIEHAEKAKIAIQVLPVSRARDALMFVADYAVERSY